MANTRITFDQPSENSRADMLGIRKCLCRQHLADIAVALASTRQAALPDAMDLPFARDRGFPPAVPPDRGARGRAADTSPLRRAPDGPERRGGPERHRLPRPAGRPA